MGEKQPSMGENSRDLEVALYKEVSEKVLHVDFQFYIDQPRIGGSEAFNKEYHNFCNGCSTFWFSVAHRSANMGKSTRSEKVAPATRLRGKTTVDKQDKKAKVKEVSKKDKKGKDAPKKQVPKSKAKPDQKQPKKQEPKKHESKKKDESKKPSKKSTMEPPAKKVAKKTEKETEPAPKKKSALKKPEEKAEKAESTPVRNNMGLVRSRSSSTDALSEPPPSVLRKDLSEVEEDKKKAKQLGLSLNDYMSQKSEQALEDHMKALVATTEKEKEESEEDDDQEGSEEDDEDDDMAEEAEEEGDGEGEELALALTNGGENSDEDPGEEGSDEEEDSSSSSSTSLESEEEEEEDEEEECPETPAATTPAAKPAGEEQALVAQQVDNQAQKTLENSILISYHIHFLFPSSFNFWGNWSQCCLLDSYCVVTEVEPTKLPGINFPGSALTGRNFRLAWLHTSCRTKSTCSTNG